MVRLWYAAELAAGGRAASLAAYRLAAVSDASRLERNRELWSLINARFTADEAPARWMAPAVTWGLFGVPETDLGVLGDVSGRHVIELGSGSAYLSAWLARAGANVVALDLSRPQLETARACQRQFAVRFPLIEANAEAVPLCSGVFDLVVTEYGASPWCDPARWVPEAARLLRPEGRLVFLTNSVLLGLCVPEEGGFASDRLLRSPCDVSTIAWPGGGIEHHPSHGDWIRLLTTSGFAVDALHELYAPPGAKTPGFYDIATHEWAARWPVEDLWVAHKRSGV
jgi:SAM-dependent methyltransferase